MTKRVTFDFETRSKSNLKKEGAYKYSLDPITRPTCLAFKVNGHPQIYFLDFQLVNTPWEKLPPKLKMLWTGFILDGNEFSAHNAGFERAIYRNILVKRYGWPEIPLKKYRCTAAKAAACSLPRSLEGCGEALKLNVQKDKRGYVAMMKTCKPTKKWNAWNKLQIKVATGVRITEKSRIKSLEPEPPMFLEYKDDPETWETLYRYCKIDVKAEEAIDLVLPDLLPFEQEIWHLNQTINWRGFKIDLPTVKKVVGIMAVESKKKLQELDTLTMGLVTKPGARKSILEFLAMDDIVLPDIRSKTVEDRLNGYDLTEDGRRLLEIRKALSMTSTRKYQAFLDRVVESTAHVSDILMYHGASTGRDTGTGVQPHNFPRGLIKMNPDRPYAHVTNVSECHPEMLQILYGDSLAILFSALLRNMIVADDGYELFVADFSKIEVAVCWWLADNTPGLKILRSGKDPYIYQASENTGLPYEAYKDYENDKKLNDDRQLGKAQVLGAQFGMGADKFRTTAFDMYRLTLTLKQSRKAITDYREANPAVPELWKAYEGAALKAVQKPGREFEAGKCRFIVKDKFLWVYLPSGRPLAYREPQIAWRVRQYDKTVEKTVNGELITTIVQVTTEPMETLEFWAVNSKTKKWSLERTWGGTLCENITQAVARDLMMPGLLRLNKKGYQALLAVHDEGICQRKKGEGTIEEFTKILCEVPPWGEGLPIEAKGWVGSRYRK